ncbi:MAG: hypothetical protein IJ736_08695 [Firmicutes bacterium]|nr:hypothetical protein [Bacillota bacterium]
MATECNGDPNLPVGDYFWNNAPYWGTSVLGAEWSSGDIAGLFARSSGVATTSYAEMIGARLIYIPNANESKRTIQQA